MSRWVDCYFTAGGAGAALGVTRRAEQIIRECTGLSRIESGHLITPDSLFELGSVSKWFTAAAVMSCVEEGVIELCSPAGEYVEGFDSPSDGSPIRVRDLLSHTSGLPDYLSAGMATPAAQLTPDYVFDQLPEWSAGAINGKAFHYAGTNYVVLARLVEIVSGKTFRDYLADRFFKPLRMVSSDVDPTGEHAKMIAWGYRSVGVGLPAYERVEDVPIATVGDGGVVSSLNEVMKWQAAFWAGEVLSLQLVEEMCTPGRLESGELIPYGYGLQIEQRAGEIWIGHTGSWVNTTTCVGRYSHADLNVTVLSNEFMGPVERISQNAFEALRP